MRNFDVARLFHEMATLLEVNDESRFRVRAYQRAAQTLESLAEDVAVAAARGGLTALPGIGRELGARIEEYLATGRIAQLNPHVDILAHPTGRRLGSREPYDVDLEAVFAAAARHGKAVEINASPDRLDLADVHARRAAEVGMPIAVSTDTHYLPELDNLELGLGAARRAWLGPAQVLNARSLSDLLAWADRDR